MAQAEIPEIIKDPTRSNTNYERGRFLGKGGFAKCYELRHMVNNEISAGKIVPKSLLVKQHQREKMAQEITLHKTLQHKYVVKLFFFRRFKLCLYYFGTLQTKITHGVT